MIPLKVRLTFIWGSATNGMFCSATLDPFARAVTAPAAPTQTLAAFSYLSYP
jgi:hypothetical protein